MKCANINLSHDWVLVPKEFAQVKPGTRAEGLLWACPCGEFRWTSYAEWEARQGTEPQAVRHPEGWNPPTEAAAKVPIAGDPTRPHFGIAT